MQRQVGHLLHGADPVDVEPVAAAELQLQALVPPPRDSLRAARHVVGVTEPDRPRRGRAGSAQAEQLVDGQAGQPALQVVQRMVDGRPRGLLARRQARSDLLERERIVAELDARQPRQCGRSGLVVPLDRRGLTETGDALVLHLDLDDVGRVLRAARDRKGLCEAHRRYAGRESHAGNTSGRKREGRGQWRA